MSFITAKGIRIPDVLMFLGFVILLGVGFFSDTTHRIFTFIGDVIMAGGYLWERFFVKPDVTSQK